jgi:tetratricopeptide (TPR) repeat protein
VSLAPILLLGSLLLQAGSARDAALRGSEALEDGRLDEAEAQLRKALELGPERPFAVWHLLSLTLFRKRELQEASAAASESLSRAPRFGPAYLVRGSAKLLQKDTEGGIEDLKRAAAVQKPPPEASSVLAEASAFLGETAGAPMDESETERKLREDPSSSHRYVERALAHRRAGRVDSALRYARAARVMDPDDPVPELILKERDSACCNLVDPTIPSRWRRTVAALQKGETEAARAGAEEILAGEPRFVPGRLLLIELAEKESRSLDALLQMLPDLSWLSARFGRLALQVEAYGAAACRLEKATALEPASGELVLLLARAELGENDTGKALASSRRALELGGDSAEAYRTLGDVYYARMEIGESIGALKRAVELDPKAAEEIASFALSSLTTDEYEALRELLTLHAKSHPDSINTLYGLGVMSLRDGRLDEAERYLVRVRELAPGHPQAHYNLALVYQRRGNDAEAKRSLAEFERLKAEDDERFLRDNRAEARRLEASRLMESGDDEGALALWQELRESPAGRPKDGVRLSETLLRVGRAEDALRELSAVLREAPFDAGALALEVKVLEKLGRGEEASRIAAGVELLTRDCR